MWKRFSGRLTGHDLTQNKDEQKNLVCQNLVFHYLAHHHYKLNNTCFKTFISSFISLQ